MAVVRALRLSATPSLARRPTVAPLVCHRTVPARLLRLHLRPRLDASCALQPRFEIAPERLLRFADRPAPRDRLPAGAGVTRALRRPRRRALVLGGTGAVGGAVVAALVAARRRTRVHATTAVVERARALAASSRRARGRGRSRAPGRRARPRARPRRRRPGARPPRSRRRDQPARPAGDLGDDDWAAMLAVNVRSAFRRRRRRWRPASRRAAAATWCCSAASTARSRSPPPVGYAATQGALSALTMALAKELGRVGRTRQPGRARHPRAGSVAGDLDERAGARLPDASARSGARARPPRWRRVVAVAGAREPVHDGARDAANGGL